ncbi:unnamed protein product [Spirodela intermedia]|uniref:Uncharacterized protein n=1 Tax=Spirodela intermedia TaxID=51605 RepID=A0A7I8JRF9_SPIIN|nr:unnamed protein product [Spirodela intermedia]CAA6672756.1 unnamed protein product [Spirodela intermedia]
MSLGMIVTRLAWMAQRLTAELWNRRSVLKSCAISRTRRWKGSLRIKSSRHGPRPETVGLLHAACCGADFLAALVASCFLGALPPVDFLAVCLVRAIFAKLSIDRSTLQQRRRREKMDQ